MGGQSGQKSYEKPEILTSRSRPVIELAFWGIEVLLRVTSSTGFPWCLRWKRICLQCRTPRFDPWVGKISWKGKWQSTPYFHLENPMDRGA